MDEETPRFVVAPVRKDDAQECMSCGSPFATAWSTTQGRAWLCRECANLNGLGCP